MSSSAIAPVIAGFATGVALIAVFVMLSPLSPHHSVETDKMEALDKAVNAAESLNETKMITKPSVRYNVSRTASYVSYNSTAKTVLMEDGTPFRPGGVEVAALPSLPADRPIIMVKYFVLRPPENEATYAVFVDPSNNDILGTYTVATMYG